MKPKNKPTTLDRLKYHVTGAIERGEKQPIEAVVQTPARAPQRWAIREDHQFTFRITNLVTNDDVASCGALEDARLIVAAPEMLEALKLLLNNDRLMNAMTKQEAQAVLHSVKRAEGND